MSASEENGTAGGAPLGPSAPPHDEVSALIADEEDLFEIPEEPSYGSWVKEAREAKGWSQDDLAAASGVSRPYISNIEADHAQNPRPKIREKLAQALSSTPPSPEAVTEVEEEAVKDPCKLGELQNFDPYDESDWPNVHGVYVFYDRTLRPVYVGKSSLKTSTIKQRVKIHEQKFWFKRPVVETAAYVTAEDPLCTDLEKILIGFMKLHALLNDRHRQFI